MPKATKLPSGNWRVRVYVGKDEKGKKRVRSFTGSDKKKIMYEANLYLVEHREYVTRQTFAKAMQEYIDIRTPVLSPSTINGYTVISKTLNREFKSFCDIELDKIKTSDVQIVVNELSLKRAPKTVRNFSGFIYSVLDNNDVRLKKWTLPQQIRPVLNIPSDDVIKEVLESAKGTELYIPILLGAFCTMRRGEICGLTMEDIDGTTIHIHRSIVRGNDNQYHFKAPKTVSSDRFVECPGEVIDIINKQGYITKYKPNQITVEFRRLLVRHNIEPFRFHDLRHYSASIQHAIGIPDVYIMQRGGWSTDQTLKSVYRHVLDKQARDEAKKANDYFSNLII